MISRRAFVGNIFLGSLSLSLLKEYNFTVSDGDFKVPKELSEEMYRKALEMAKTKIKGGPTNPVYKKPFVDAAFSDNIFYWDTCFIACYAKYHPDELPIYNALDNFYERMDDDGFICREYTKEGKAMWPKEHPVSVNPPLLAFAELELYEQVKNRERLRKVYPSLKKHLEYWTKAYRGDDMLYFNDALGSGMDNIDRFPRGWKDDGKGIKVRNLYPEIFKYEGLSSLWNTQGRAVDTSAQVCLFALNMIDIARLAGHDKDIQAYSNIYTKTKDAINARCWNAEDGFYYDLAYGKQIKRKHIGMYWTLIADIVPDDRKDAFIRNLTDTGKFWTTTPVATLSADEKEYDLLGDYWHGGVWAPTNYMVIRGLQKSGNKGLAEKLARKYYDTIAIVYKDTGTFWENYAPGKPEKGNIARPDFCGWTAIGPITIYREFIKE